MCKKCKSKVKLQNYMLILVLPQLQAAFFRKQSCSFQIKSGKYDYICEAGSAQKPRGHLPALLDMSASWSAN